MMVNSVTNRTILFQKVWFKFIDGKDSNDESNYDGNDDQPDRAGHDDKVDGKDEGNDDNVDGKDEGNDDNKPDRAALFGKIDPRVQCVPHLVTIHDDFLRQLLHLVLLANNHPEKPGKHEHHAVLLCH